MAVRYSHMSADFSNAVRKLDGAEQSDVQCSDWQSLSSPQRSQLPHSKEVLLAKSHLFYWRPRWDSNPCYRRESAWGDGNLLKTQAADGSQSTCLVPLTPLIGRQIDARFQPFIIGFSMMQGSAVSMYIHGFGRNPIFSVEKNSILESGSNITILFIDDVLCLPKWLRFSAWFDR
jgi:hypothetical protein